MTRKEIVDAVLNDRFSPSQRGDAEDWVGARYWWLWSLKPWTFKQASADVQATAGNSLLGNVPSDLRAVRGLFTNQGRRLRWLEPADFDSRYYDADDPVQGDPCHFTVWAGQIIVGPTPVTTATYRMLYELEWQPLADDDAVPLLPEGSHMGLVFGGAATGLKLQNDPTWQAFDEDFQAALTVLESQYLVDARGDSGAYGKAVW